jgi:hypothetical protein
VALKPSDLVKTLQTVKIVKNELVIFHAINSWVKLQETALERDFPQVLHLRRALKLELG